MKIKNILVLLILFVSTFSYGQDLEKDKLWRTKGVYDSLGNFIERAKIQSFLYSSDSNQFHRLRTQDKINMETGDTKIFIYKDTLNLTPLSGITYQLNAAETLILHTKDSLTITYNGYTFPYLKLNQNPNEVNADIFNSNFINVPLIETIDNTSEYQFTYLDTGRKKIKPLDRDSEWESVYKLINFNGFIFLQGITSAPKLITHISEKTIYFLQLDYRFDVKKGELKKD